MAVNNKPKVIEIIPPKDMWQGPANAPVKLVEYGDYESEACAKAHEVVRKLVHVYGEQLGFNFRHFPLTQVHQRAHKAAEAAVGAGQAGKFWEMHNILFKNRKQLGSISLKEYAREAGVSDKHFLPRLIDSFYGWTVRADLLDGLALGVRDIPTFFINDKLYTGKPTFDGLSKAIEEVLPGKHNAPAKQRA
jgi:protein-disulfide isomerase